MRKKRALVSLIAIAAILFISTLVITFLNQKDPYRFFVGLGTNFDIAPDDGKVLISYYSNGDEAIYEADVTGENVRKLVDSEEGRLHSPKYSPDGERILFLSSDSDGINSLMIAHRDGSNQKRLSENNMHVSEAVYSASGDTIFYTAIAEEDFKKAEGETKEGLDLYSVSITGEDNKQLTDKNYFSMNALSISPDGDQVYYSLYNGSREQLTSYSLETGAEGPADGSSLLPVEIYSTVISPDGTKLAYTSIAEESRNSSLFEYDLFIMDAASGKKERMTNLNTSVIAPVFFHKENRIAFLEYTNWAGSPEKYEFMIQDVQSKKLDHVTFYMPPESKFNRSLSVISNVANGQTAIGLYILLMILLISYLSYFHTSRRYLPAKVNLALVGVGVVITIALTFGMNPWVGMAFGGLTAIFLGTSIVAFIFAFILGRLGKK
ncbi:DPP IV N-terminal domain-containing protein [Robertmurraya sp. P23]|uniref:TolB family protein n=1 Tax=Robertmurraya sp. P23 TaxID=3436931 RepID=UPI003D9789EE